MVFGLDGRGQLVFTPELGPRGRELVEPERIMLTNIAIGRLTGHAIGECTTCRRAQMIAITNSSGTSRTAASVGWPKCRMTPKCAGKVVVSPDDLAGVKRPPRKRPRLVGPPRPTFDMRWRDP